MRDTTHNLSALSNRFQAEMIAFCQRIVQTPSLPGEEGDVARLIRAEMERLGYDQVWADDWGNVVLLTREAGGLDDLLAEGDHFGAVTIGESR